MLPNSAHAIIQSDQPEKWQEILSDLITDPKELLKILELDPRQYPGSASALEQFPLKVPRPFLSRIEKGNWRDPLLLQILPTPLEQQDSAGYSADPLAESAANPLPGLLHKYRSRVLLSTVPHCAIHCRYCFRRHFDYAGNSPSREQWAAVFDYIANDSSIEEVILSGGDPLAAADRHLQWMLRGLAQIDHVRTLRIHTRLPIVIPQRVTAELLQVLTGTRLQPVVVLHCNHARELDSMVSEALSLFTDNRVMLLNQAVLLKDVNDNYQCLSELSKELFRNHVLPYYLHLPDKVAGTSHFQVSAATGRILIQQLQDNLPGYLVPHLVREEAGANAKLRIA